MQNQKAMMFSRRDLAKLIVPIALQNILTIAIAMVDSIMIAGTSEEAFAGVSLISSLDTLLITLFSAFTAGGSVVLAQALGKGNLENAREAAKQMLYAATAAAALIAAVVLILRVPLLRLLFGEVEASVMQNALSYFFFMGFSFPFLAIEYSIGATYRVQGNSVTPLVISIFMNLFNIGGNALLIYGLDMGATGAAISSLCSRFLGASVMLVLIHSKRNTVYLSRLLHYRPDFATIKGILRIGIPNGIENSMFQFGRLLTSSLISTLGTIAIAANAAALQVANFQYQAGGAIQAAMVTVVGRCVGANDKEQSTHYARQLLRIGYALVGGVVILSCVFSRPLLALFGLSADAFSTGQQLLLFHGVCSLVLWPAAFCLPSAFRAASDVRFTMIISTVSMWVCRVFLAYCFAPETVSFFGVISFPGLSLGIHGVWLAMGIDWVVRFVLFVLRFARGKWLKHHFAT